MRVLFMGSRPLGMKILEFLAHQDGLEVDYLMCGEEQAIGHLWLGYCRHVEDNHSFLAAQKYDLIVSVNYDRIIKEPLLSSAKLGCVNVHHSHNLRIRGRHCATHAILLARKTGVWEHGTTLHYMAEEL